MDAEVSESMFKSIDAIRKILKSIETCGNDGNDPFTNLIADFETLHASKLAKAKAEEAAVKKQDTNFAPPTIAVKPARIPTPNTVEPKPTSVTAPASTQIAAPISKPNSANGAPVALSNNGESSAADSTIRVGVALLDKLMTRVGELVLARNQILQFNSTINDSALYSATQRLNLITTELQEGVMKTRMQPIGTVWSKFPRLVRDLAAMCEKDVRIEMEGKDTELDKTIIEAIKDPPTEPA